MKRNSPNSSHKKAHKALLVLCIVCFFTAPVRAQSADVVQVFEQVATLIRDLGFDPVDAGPLHVARYSEPFTLLIAKLAYEGDDGPALAYRFERYEERS